ncbi:MAG: TAXI family TRAP transporter solute-binding subunit [Bacillota bacterium]
MRKRLLLVMLVLILVVSLVAVAGCGKKPADNDQSGGEQKPEIRDIVIGSGGAGGSWYLLGAQLTEILKNEMPDIAFSSVEGGAVTNVRHVNKGIDMDIGMAALPDIFDALGKTGPFSEEDISNVAPIINFALDYVQLTVLAKSDIKSVADLKNKNILPGPRNWGIEFIMRDLLEIYGMSYDSIQSSGGSVSFVSWGEAPSLINDGHADLAAFKGAYPIANIMEIEATNKARIIGIEPDMLEKFFAKRQGFFEGVIPAGTYQGQEEDALTIAHTSVIFARKDLSEDFVYEFLKVIMENADKLNQIKGINLTANPLKGIDPDILHPGAKRYYQEKGML